MRQVAVLWFLGFWGCVALIPYLRELLGERLSKSAEEIGVTLNVLLAINMAQNLFFIAIFVFVGLLCANRVGFRAPVSARIANREDVDLRAWFWEMLGPALGLGVGVALAVLALDVGLRSWTPEALQSAAASAPDWWRGLLASLYGGIVEELQLRLGVLTLFAWVLHKLFAKAGDPLPGWMFWTANGAAALLFGAGHLPAVAALTPLTGLLVARILLLNGVFALAFGFLYRRHGLEAAMLSHFAADIVLHVLPALWLG
jgi:hypothetical protein